MASGEKIILNKNFKEGGLYLHVPFCSRRCGYCAFYAAGTRKADWGGFIDEILSELKLRINELPSLISTIYIGGGTPSQMPVSYFNSLISGMKRIISDSGGTLEIKEFSIECNPDDVILEKVSAWKSAGVTRVSLGVQSFDEQELKTLDRVHNRLQVEKSIELLKEHFNNISVDLIFGIPGQTLESWKMNLEKAFGIGIQHLSAYSLSYEERTLITYRRNNGMLAEAEETDTTEMYRILLQSAEGHGFRHYEVSNFAMPGYESVHNSSYWKGLPYLGIGPSASSYDGCSKRVTNISDFKNWVGKGAEEQLTQEDLIVEYIMTRLRREEGLDLNEFKALFGEEEAGKLMKRARKFLIKGELEVSQNCLMVKKEGWMIHDYIVSSLI